MKEEPRDGKKDKICSYDALSTFISSSFPMSRAPLPFDPADFSFCAFDIMSGGG